MFSLRRKGQAEKRATTPSPVAASPHGGELKIGAFRPGWLPDDAPAREPAARPQDLKDEHAAHWHGDAGGRFVTTSQPEAEVVAGSQNVSRTGSYEQQPPELQLGDTLTRVAAENAELISQRDNALFQADMLQTQQKALEAALRASVQRGTALSAQLQDMTRQRAAAAAEQLAALQAAAEDMQLARDSEQLALALALTQNSSGSTAGAQQPSTAAEGSQPVITAGKGTAQLSKDEQLERAARSVRALSARCAAAEAQLADAEAQHSVLRAVHAAAKAAAALSTEVCAAERAASGLKAARQLRRASAAAAALAVAMEQAERAKAALGEAAAAATLALTGLDASAVGDGCCDDAVLAAAAGEELRSDLVAACHVGAALTEAMTAAQQQAVRGGSPTKRLRRFRDIRAGAYSAVDPELSDDSDEDPFAAAPETGSSIMTPLRGGHRRTQSKGRSQQRGWLARVLHSELHAQPKE